jgi:hypothetical protein
LKIGGAAEAVKPPSILFFIVSLFDTKLIKHKFHSPEPELIMNAILYAIELQFNGLHALGYLVFIMKTIELGIIILLTNLIVQNLN